ncbi:MAG: RNA polymerase sigma factor [Bryobacteraceae bacterium]
MAQQRKLGRHTDGERPDEPPANQDPNGVRAGVQAPLESAIRSWSALVEGVQAGDRAAMEELYTNFSRGIRYYFCKHLGPSDLDDRVHDAYLTVVQAIRAGSLREPEALMGFVRTIIRRQVAAGIDAAVQSRRERAELEVGTLIADIRQNPEQEAINRQKTQLMVQVLDEISARDKEILTRFYLRGQPQEKICHEMKLSETQFRLLKSRAKARFGELGRKRLAVAEPEFGLRKVAGA